MPPSFSVNLCSMRQDMWFTASKSVRESENTAHSRQLWWRQNFCMYAKFALLAGKWKGVSCFGLAASWRIISEEKKILRQRWGGANTSHLLTLPLVNTCDKQREDGGSRRMAWGGRRREGRTQYSVSKEGNACRSVEVVENSSVDSTFLFGQNLSTLDYT